MIHQIENFVYDAGQPSAMQMWELIDYVDKELLLFGDRKKRSDRIIAQLNNNKSLSYHNLNHLTHVLKVGLQLFGDQACDWDTEKSPCLMALAFHDIIYVPGNTDNERRSADFFKEVALQIDDEEIERIYNNILATKHDALPTSESARLTCDIDLIGLSASPDVFRSNSAAIRKEYPDVSDFVFYNKRIDFMRSMLNRGYPIYTSEIFQNDPYLRQLESKARKNMDNEILECILELAILETRDNNRS